MNGTPAGTLDRPPADTGLESAGFERFLFEQRDALVRFLSARLGNEEDAQDAAQEACARLVRYRTTGASEDWRPLLYRIAVNIVTDRQRTATTRRAAGHVPFERALHALPSEDPSPDEHLARQQLVTRMWRIVQGLPPRCRDIYVLQRVEGMSQRQIAELYGISVKAVEKQMTRALSILRRELGDWAPAALLQDAGDADTSA